ncbi:MAG: MATE family efflux transporter [Bacteroidales bacterium]
MTLNKQILRLAVPNIVTNITIPILASVDIGLMGHTGFVKFIGAISLGNMIFSLLFWIFSFLRMGTSGFVAQSYGKRDLSESVHILLRSVIMGFSAGVLLIALQFPIEALSFKLLKASEGVEELAKQYFRIRIYAAPATLLIYVATGWFIGMQNAKFPMILAISVNSLNVVLSIIFIRVLNLGSNGVAYANLISQWFGFLLILILLRPYLFKLKKHINTRQLFDKRKFIAFINVNRDIFIRTLCLISVLTFYTAESARMGDELLAVNTILFQFFYFFSYFIDGFGYAAEALVGKHYGAKNALMLKTTIKRLFVWGVGIALIFTLVYFIFYDNILHLLTDQEEIVQIAHKYIFWIWLVPAFSFSAFLWDGIYVGATASAPMRNSMIIASIVLFFPIYFIFKGSLNNHALWLAMSIFLLARGVLLGLVSKKHIVV